MVNRERERPSLMEHEELGRSLKVARTRLMEMMTRYPKGSRQVVLGRTIVKKVDVFRSEMDDRMFEEHGDDGNVQIYYGEVQREEDVETASVAR